MPTYAAICSLGEVPVVARPNSEVLPEIALRSTQLLLVLTYQQPSHKKDHFKKTAQKAADFDSVDQVANLLAFTVACWLKIEQISIRQVSGSH